MKFGFYESDITPPLGEIMPGYFSRRRAVTVHDRLYSKAFVIESDGTASVIIAIDTCFVPNGLHDKVTQRIQKFTGITPDCVTITSTHTHLGAPVSPYTLTDCPADETYADVFYRLVADSAILAYQKLDEADAYFASARVEGLAFCRNYVMKDGTYLTNSIDYSNIDYHLDVPDEELCALFVEKDGKKIGAFVSYPLHQDTVSPEVLGYSGDYASAISDRLKEFYGHDFVSVFGIGTCGDVNHMNISLCGSNTKHYAHRGIGAKLAKAIEDAASDAVRITGDTAQCKKSLSIARRKLSFEEFRDSVIERFKVEDHAMNVGNIVSYYMLNLPDTADMYVHVIAIGELAIYLLPGELYACYGLRIKAESPFKHNMVIENCNTNAGYIPSLKAFAPQSRLYEISPAESSNLIPEAGTIITDIALDIANTLSGSAK